ncbi:MAG: 30S ribosomal protein S6 [Firmicutes bacterium]|nr:30S ribosomal protein S6 [Bacillota bacterium]
MTKPQALILAAITQQTRSRKDHKEVENMNKYEVLYIIKTGLDEAKKEALVERFATLAKEASKVEPTINKWGNRRFAYPIDYKNDGYYVLMNFESEPDFPRELERQMRITDEIVRFMVVRK